MTAFDEYINLGDKGMLNAIGGARDNDKLIATVGNNIGSKAAQAPTFSRPAREMTCW
jgi:hypothetical protein